MSTTATNPSGSFMNFLANSPSLRGSGMFMSHAGGAEFVGGGSTNHLIPDKRNRNPNWTDGEIIRFLEILQQEEILKDLCAQRNKQVFCHVAERLCSEGADKTWDQCRIKLKNLKSQYRYVRERVPEITQLNLEDDDNMKQLIVICQGKGISPSSLKHLRYLRRFLCSMSKYRNTGGQHEFPKLKISASVSSSNSGIEQEDESVSPPCSPAQKVKILLHEDEDDDFKEEPEIKKPRLELNGGQRCIEKFNQDMMEQFLEHQRRVQASFHKWEMERQRLHESAMEKWRSEARDHEKVLFGMFVQVMGECNKALTSMFKDDKERSNQSP